MKSPYNPDYGLPDEIRFRAVHDAVQTSVREAAENNNVHVSTVYKWKKDLITGERA